MTENLKNVSNVSPQDTLGKVTPRNNWIVCYSESEASFLELDSFKGNTKSQQGTQSKVIMDLMYSNKIILKVSDSVDSSIIGKVAINVDYASFTPFTNIYDSLILDNVVREINALSATEKQSLISTRFKVRQYFYINLDNIALFIEA